MVIPAGILIWGATKKQRKGVQLKFQKRKYEIENILKHQNQAWMTQGLSWRLGGKLGGWIELNVSDTRISIGM